MIKPNYMEKLLDGVGVEWKSLGEVAKIQRGASPRPIAKFITDKEDGVPWIKIGDTSPNSKYVNKTEQRITPEGAMKSRILKKGDFIMSNSMSFGRPYILNIDGAIHDGWASISDFGDKLNSDYLYHYLSSDLVRSYWISKINSGSVSNLNSDIIKSLEIPIPPLKVQEEIVRILDAFTELTAELTAELTGRKKQYEYYRDRLLTFGEGEVEWKTLGEVAEKIYSGGTPKTGVTEYWENGTIPWMSSGEVNLDTVYATEKYITKSGLENSSAKFVPKNSIVIALAGQGKTRGKVARIRIDLTTNQSLAALTFDESKVNTDYIFHYLKTQYDNLRQISSGSGTRGGLNLQMISNYKIPIPTISEQARIVSILDKFDALISSITGGLPREIELRQKQYEYYRNMLLSFSKEEVEG